MNMRELATNTARLAGERLAEQLNAGGAKTQINEKKFGETVTNFDRDINEFIIKELKIHVPEHSFVTEETEAIENGDGAKRWFIDPIDGTNNFIRNIPIYGVSVGYEEDHVLRAGAVYDPLNKTLFDASLEDGAFVNGTPLTVSPVSKSGNAMVVEGYGYDPRYREEHANILNELNRTVKFRRNLGTAALALAYVAQGGIDACVFTGIQSWDCAAGAVIVRAAGGRVTNFEGKDWTTRDDMIIASNGHIHDELLAIMDQ